MTNITKFESNIERLVTQDKIMVAMNQDPPKEWIKKHPFIADFNYLPIERDLLIFVTSILIEIMLFLFRLVINNPFNVFFPPLDKVSNGPNYNISSSSCFVFIFVLNLIRSYCIMCVLVFNLNS